MNKTILAMILAAFCSSGWWAGAMFNHPAAWVPAVISSLGMLIWIIYETCDTLDKLDL